MAKGRFASFSPTLRLGLFYAALYLTSGVYSPYLTVWLKAGGLSGGAMGVIIALPLIARALTAPMIAAWADRFALRRTPILLLAVSAAMLFAVMAVWRGFWPWLILWFAGSSLFSACTPLSDVIVLRLAARQGFAYAVPRGVGSAGYVLANILGGALIGVFGPLTIPIWMATGGGLTAVATPLTLPPEPVSAHAVAKDRWGGAGALLRNRAFMLMIVSSGLIQAGHAFYYSFSALIWRDQGLSPTLIGLLWGVGVGMEVLFLWFGEPWRRRVGADRLLILGGLGGLVRWTAFAFSPPAWMLFPLQGLHALSFTATFIASLQLVERLSPPESASAAQSLNAALYGGVMIGLATLASGPLYDHFGAGGYIAMSALVALGLAGAIKLRRQMIAYA
jgi:PPP family 3-phenylpropionic acid transporter